MVKITYNEDNKEEVEAVENYFWFIYQLEVIEFDILRNTMLTQDIIDSCDSKFKNTSSINKRILECINKQDINRFVKLYNNLLTYKYSYEGEELLTMIDVLYDLISRGIKCMKKEYKCMIIHKFGEN